MHGKVVVITGVSSGIGKEAAVEMAARGAQVVAVARGRERGEAAVREIRARSGSSAVALELADLSSLAQVRDLASRLLAAHPRIDVLCNNAGLVLSRRRETADGFETQLAVNHLAPFLLTNLLLERLRQSAPSRIVNTSSRAHARAAISWDDLARTKHYSALGVYGETKLMNLLFTRELSRRLEGSGVTANALHPGVVRTSIGADGDLAFPVALVWKVALRFIGITPAEGAKTIVYLASSPDVARVSGEYFDECRISRSASRSRDPEAAVRLWQASARMVGLAPE